MIDVKQLPYIQIKNNKRTNYLARFILKKIKNRLLKEMPYHYLVFQRKDKILKIIQKLTKKYHYFLRFDIEKYYPSIDNQKLIEILKRFLNSRRGKKLLENEIIPFIEKYQIFKKGVPIGNFLGWILAGLYLLPLDFKIFQTKKPFLRIQDDYLIFLKSKKEPLRILKEIIEPRIRKN